MARAYSPADCARSLAAYTSGKIVTLAEEPRDRQEALALVNWLSRQNAPAQAATLALISDIASSLPKCGPVMALEIAYKLLHVTRQP